MKKIKEKNNRINIYISQNAKKFLDEVKHKYKVSYSTIIDTLIKCTYQNETVYNSLKENYIIAEHKKTSVRPRISTYLRNLYKDNELSKIYTNIVEIYKNKELLKKYCILWNLPIETYKTKVGNELAKIRETYYDYNNQVRNQARAIRENKDYYRKILEQ